MKSYRLKFMRLRWIFIFLIVVAIIYLSFYGVNHRPWIHIKDCLEHPDQYDSKLVTEFDEPRVGEIYADGFLLIQKRIAPILVYSDTTDLVQNEYVGLQAIFHKEGYLKATSVCIAKNREEKIWISVLPVFFVGILFIRYFRFNVTKFQIELRKHA
ncbi:hypothetical protein JW824_15190 [bacterium]|nr:hypothetical protein [bacterium]